MDMRRRELEFVVSDGIFLKMSPMKVERQFDGKGKMRPHFIGPYNCEKDGEGGLRVEVTVRDVYGEFVFHILMLTLYKPDPSHILTQEKSAVNEGLSYEEKPVQIIDRQVMRLRTKDVASVKVMWQNNNIEKATWEA
ncbi:uncharacterized protein LOC132042581 [Lycium ferocissimum]|uniref:uncharacterized protein LOC132042581 n=1 Tax=Lycium ferocissimum TaxID=112874 RepID=UPI002815861F|nr:uncharacterized protein LOC132042581 [Lycium ferocissimum]